MAVKAKGKDKRKKTLAGTVADRIAVFYPDVQPFLWTLHALVKGGAWTAAMIVDERLFDKSPIATKGTRGQKIRKMQALVDIVTLPEEPG